jgi:thiol-disulfide isomerase/thioredoxin
MSLKSLEGKIEHIGNTKKKKAYVIFFLSPECPLCQSYSLTIKQIYEKYQAKGAEFVAIIPGTDYSLLKIVAFRNGYGLKDIPFFLDPNYAFSKQTKASITPEVFVLNQNNQLVYNGRIDNWAYELGKKRAVITEHDLKNALENLCSGIKFKPYQTKAVGCFIN